MTAPVEMYKFINDCRNKHLTLVDVKRMNVGDKLEAVIWDRNFEEYWIWKNAEHEVSFPADRFFHQNHHQVTYLGNMTWNIHYPFGDDVVHSIELDVSGLQTIMKWYPLDENGNIVLFGRTLHWTEFPNDTRIGWRGPMMLWEELYSMPDVYMKDNYFGEELE